MAKVTIYTRQMCGFCVAAKRLLEGKGVDYEEIDATFSLERRQEMTHRSGGSTFPQIFIGETHVGGCDELHMLERNGNLDNLLVPAA